LAGDRYFDLGGGYGVVMSAIAGFVPKGHVRIAEGEGPDLSAATGFVMVKGYEQLLPVFVDYDELRGEYAQHMAGGEEFAPGWDG
jgi:hypothetical protein